MRSARGFRAPSFGMKFIVAFLGMLLVGGAARGQETFTVPAFPDIQFAQEDVAQIPPGDVIGQAQLPDGQPHTDVPVSLIDPETGEVIATATTDENGNYTFSDVPEGMYVIRAGDPGVFSVVELTPAAVPGMLVFVVPLAAVTPVAAAAPPAALTASAVAAWLVTPTGLAVVGGGTLAAGYAIYEIDRRRDRDRVISPIVP